MRQRVHNEQGVAITKNRPLYGPVLDELSKIAAATRNPAMQAGRIIADIAQSTLSVWTAVVGSAVLCAPSWRIKTRLLAGGGAHGVTRPTRIKAAINRAQSKRFATLPTVFSALNFFQ